MRFKGFDVTIMTFAQYSKARAITKFADMPDIVWLKDGDPDGQGELRETVFCHGARKNNIFDVAQEFKSVYYRFSAAFDGLTEPESRGFIDLFLPPTAAIE